MVRKYPQTVAELMNRKTQKEGGGGGGGGVKAELERGGSKQV